MALVAGENLELEDADGDPVSFTHESVVPSVEMISAEDMLLDTSTDEEPIQLLTSLTTQTASSTLGHADEVNELAPMLSISVKKSAISTKIRDTKKVIKIGIPQGSASAENKKQKKKVNFSFFAQPFF